MRLASGGAWRFGRAWPARGGSERGCAAAGVHCRCSRVACGGDKAGWTCAQAVGAAAEASYSCSGARGGARIGAGRGSGRDAGWGSRGVRRSTADVRAAGEADAIGFGSRRRINGGAAAVREAKARRPVYLRAAAASSRSERRRSAHARLREGARHGAARLQRRPGRAPLRAAARARA